MASQFTGLHMRVVLRDPAGHQLTGTVRDVQAGSSLTLTNVFIAATREWVPQIRIDASNIADLSEVNCDGPEPKPPAEKPPAQTYTRQQPPSQPPVQISNQPAQPAFVDPAILSLGRRPKSAASGKQKSVPEKDGDETDATAQPGVLYGIHVGRPSLDSGDEHTIVASVKDLKIDPVVIPKDVSSSKSRPAQEASGPTQQQQKKKARRHPKAHKDHLGETQAAVQTQGHGKGWRQTPILQSTASFQPFSSLKRNGKHGKNLMDNGWASEDVTEEMGDFDFENNLAKFDKHKIFDQMRKEDQVDDASRLVAHNRRPKPGTAGGKNLHYTENVLDMPPTTSAPNADYWNSEADVGANGSERLSGREPKNGGQAARRPDSKTGGSRRSQSRKASTAVPIGGQPLSRVNSSLRYQASRRSSPTTGHRSTDYEQQQKPPGLYLVPSNRRVETISTLQMLNIENIAANEIGFSETLMAENAGRGIAEVAVTALSDPAMKVRFEMVVAGASSDASVRSSTIVILAGNNKSGIRALAAGRHLRNKNFDVVVCLVGVERERDLLEDLRRQIQLYRNFGGRVLSKHDFFEYLRKGSGAAGGLSISLIIDALLGLTMSFEELRVGDQASVYELMEWANRNEAFVLAVDVPSGIDPTSGNVAIIDGGHLFVKPRYVVAIGAPKKGLLEAVTPPPDDDDPSISTNIAHEDEWRLFIADLGLGSAIWRKAGTKIRKGIEFDGKWVLEMKYRGVEAEEDED
ncbi:hypothetical protein TARUN_8843 [Trichoderma arundinaceum]|uniref:Enhancer of mRNA-decapping protein 3 n=1 Tax=Trichoderma arundinaceum TaxID=490622 RepID=A0A395NBX0_TRIAR|nr:hypothetical protein TARUN_8843 [Trichoderma arundinaceum]